MTYPEFPQGMPAQSLSQSDKAAAILLAMGKPVAGKLLRFFEQPELQAIIASAQRLRAVPPDELETLVAEFEELFTEGAGLMDNARVMEGILEEGLTPDEVDGLLGRRVGFISEETPIWVRVEKTDPAVVSDFLAGESPQTVAYIVSMLPSEAAGRLVMKLPSEKRADIVHRALNMKAVNSRVSAIIERRLGEYLATRESATASGSSDKVVRMMNELAKPEVEELLGNLETISKDDVAKVRPRIFLFEDLPSVPLKSRVTLFNDLSSEVITMALKGAPADLREAALSSIGARQRRMIEADLDSDLPGSERDVAVARRSIAQEAIRLAGLDKIVLREAVETPAAA